MFIIIAIVLTCVHVFFSLRRSFRFVLKTLELFMRAYGPRGCGCYSREEWTLYLTIGSTAITCPGTTWRSILLLLAVVRLEPRTGIRLILHHFVLPLVVSVEVLRRPLSPAILLRHPDPSTYFSGFKRDCTCPWKASLVIGLTRVLFVVFCIFLICTYFITFL